MRSRARAPGVCSEGASSLQGPGASCGSRVMIEIYDIRAIESGLLRVVLAAPSRDYYAHQRRRQPQRLGPIIFIGRLFFGQFVSFPPAPTALELAPFALR